MENISDINNTEANKPSSNIEDKILEFLVNNPKVTNILVKSLVEMSRAKKMKLFAEYLIDSISLSREKIENLFKKNEIGHPPNRIESPHKKFESDIDTNEKTDYENMLHYIITCSNFNTDGKVNRFMKKLVDTGVGYVLESLTPNKINNCEVKVEVINDQYESIPYKEILEQCEISKQKVVISFAGILVTQYNRAFYIATKIKAEAIKRGVGDKVDILFGGYHIRSGHKETFEEIYNTGFTAVQGEVEDGRLGNILTDAVHNRLKNKYAWLKKDKLDKEIELNSDKKNFLSYYHEKPKLEGNPMPVYPKSKGETKIVQLGRGCAYDCSFCCVCQIDGHQMRARSPEEAELFFRSLHENNTKSIFLADDNFYMNKNKIEILDTLIKLQKEGIKFTFMIQCDLKIEKSVNGVKEIDYDFMDKCEQAGVNMIFTGSESFDYAVLRGMKKNHNIRGGEKDFVTDMRDLSQEWQKRNISVTFTCIVGNKEDKKGVGETSAKIALNDIGVNLLVPFTFNLFPGSKDYDKLSESKDINLDLDMNAWASSHSSLSWKNNLSAEEIDIEYKNLVNEFYKIENMKKTCTTSATTRHFLWYILSNKINFHGMNNAIWRKIRSEKYDEKEFQENKNICINNFQSKK